MNLDYFISSLPLLLEGQSAKTSVDEFRTMASEGLSGKLKEAVLALLDGGASSHPFVVAWRDLDGQVRNAIAFERAKRRGISPSETPKADVSGFNASIIPAVTAAFAEADPLKREVAIAHLRWTLLDELQGVQPLSENVVLAFAVKLKINEMLLSIDKEKGSERFIAFTD